jgi:hypothetical protein
VELVIFRLNNRWIDGSVNRSRMDNFFANGREDQHQQAFELDADEPLLGIAIESVESSLEDASDWQLRELAMYSAVYDIFSNSLPVELVIETV